MDLYAENILDHYKNPHNKGKLENASASFADSNPLCGDKIVIGIRVNENGVIEDVGFTGEGCAISQASASLLTDEILGKTVAEVKALPNEKVYELLGVPLTTNRVKCALLSLVALKKALALTKFNA